MKRKMFILTMFSLILMFSLSMVSAEDLNATDGISFDDTLEIDEAAQDDTLKAGNTIYISPDGRGTGSSESDPTNWNQAISKATNGDTIQFSDGNYTNIKGNIYSSIELKGSGNTIIDAQKDGGFFSTYAGSTVTIENLSFVNAYTGDKQGSPDGAETQYDGEGGIVNNGVLIVKNCYFASNQGIGTEGGAIHNSGTCYIYDSTFYGNGGKKGGAIYSDKNSKLYMYDSLVNRCVSREGSAVHAKEAYVEIHNCSVVNASAKNGLFYVKKSTIKIHDSYFYNSKAVDAAGVINIDKESTVEVYNSTFNKISSTGTKLWFHNENGTGNGGAIVVEKEARNVIIKDCEFTECSAKGYGGAIYIQSSTTINIDNCTFKSNNAAYGNHIYSYPSANYLNIKNSLFEIDSTIETADINVGGVESVKVSYDVGTNNILKPTVNLLVDGVLSQSGISTPSNVNLNNMAKGTHNVSLSASDSSGNRYIFSQESSLFGVGVNTTSDDNKTSQDNATSGGNATGNDNATSGDNATNNTSDENKTDESNASSKPITLKDTIIVVDSKFSRVANDFAAGERGAMFYAVLQDIDGIPLVNKTVQIAVNGPIYNVTTDSEGRAGLTVNLANANVYTYALSFKGDDEYNAAYMASSKLTVTKKSTSISASAKTFKVKAKKTVSVTLKTSKNPYDGKTYLSAGKKLTLKVNGKTYTAKINAKGVAKFTVKLTKKGKYTAKISFGGDKTYKACSKSITLTIK